MATSDNPAAPRRMLMAALRAARSEAGLTREEAAENLGFSLSKLTRIEGGDQGVSRPDLRAMIALYRITDESRVGELTQLALGSRRQVWWSGYRDIITRQFGQYLGLEGSASCIRVFHPTLVPALLHTPDYAFELLSVRMSEERARELVRLRAERQERIFGKAASPKLRFVFGEEAFIRPIGPPEVMQQQLRHLVTMAAKASVSIRIVPLNAGAHPGLSGSFILLDLEESKEVLAFFEGAASDLVNRDDKQLTNTTIEHFNALTDLALSEDDSQSLIGEGIKKFS